MIKLRSHVRIIKGEGFGEEKIDEVHKMEKLLVSSVMFAFLITKIRKHFTFYSGHRHVLEFSASF